MSNVKIIANFSILSVATFVLLVFQSIEDAYGHAFGQRFDLPIPLEYYLTGAAGAVAFSFLLVALFVKSPIVYRNGDPRINLLNWRWGRFCSSKGLVRLLRFFAVGLFLITLLAGLVGTQDPKQNLMPTMLWIIWWTGMAYFSALVGDLWRIINPWNTLFYWAEGVYMRIRPAASALSLNLSYPSWLGVWPACALFVLFVWGELIWTANAIPANLSIAVVCYSGVTWLGMFIYGRKNWLHHGEAFTLVFGLLARFAPLEMRGGSTPGGSQPMQYPPFQREWNLRPFGAGLLVDNRVPVSLMVFVLLMLSTVTFDGFMGTPLWSGTLQSLPDWRPLQPLLFQMEMSGVPRDMVLSTLGLILFPLVFGGIYLFFAWLIKLAVPFPVSVIGAQTNREGAGSTLEVGAYFVFSLVPIALAYHLAHYLSFFLTVGQLVIPLASDPLGWQWDLFGSADYQVNIAVVGARFVWNTSVVAIVVGHIIAVYLAHVLALRVLGSRKQALISQIPMLVLMVFYTTFSLWILAQPLVE